MAMTPTPPTPPAAQTAPPSAVDLATSHSITEFLYREALALDERRFRDWFGMLTGDVRYEIPVRVTRESLAEWELSPTSRVLDDDHQTLDVRIQRLETDFAWAEQPPSRTRHYVTNVIVDPTDNPVEYLVHSNCFIYRSRGESPEPSLYSLFRKDTVRATADGWRLARRWAAFDQSLINAHNLSIFV